MRRSQKTRDLLIQAWRLLVTQQSAGPITIKRLCERAGLNRGTFYLHFDSIEEIHLSEEERIAQTILSFTERFNRSSLVGTNPIDELVAIFSPVLSYFSEHREEIPLMLMLIEDRRFRARLSDGIRINLERWFERRLDGDPDAPYVIQYLGSAIFGVVSHWLRTGAKRPPSEIVSIVVRLNWDGPLHWGAGERTAAFRSARSRGERESLGVEGND